jgi:hypothetical protein
MSKENLVPPAPDHQEGDAQRHNKDDRDYPGDWSQRCALQNRFADTLAPQGEKRGGQHDDYGGGQQGETKQRTPGPTPRLLAVDPVPFFVQALSQAGAVGRIRHARSNHLTKPLHNFYQVLIVRQGYRFFLRQQSVGHVGEIVFERAFVIHVARHRSVRG